MVPKPRGHCKQRSPTDRSCPDGDACLRALGSMNGSSSPPCSQRSRSRHPGGRGPSDSQLGPATRSGTAANLTSRLSSRRPSSGAGDELAELADAALVEAEARRGHAERLEDLARREPRSLGLPTSITEQPPRLELRGDVLDAGDAARPGRAAFMIVSKTQVGEPTRSRRPWCVRDRPSSPRSPRHPVSRAAARPSRSEMVDALHTDTAPAQRHERVRPVPIPTLQCVAVARQPAPRPSTRSALDDAGANLSSDEVVVARSPTSTR